MDEEPLPSTWATRELPILRSALARIDTGDGHPELREIQEDTGLTPTQVLAGINALRDADPPFLDFELAGGWTDTTVGGGYVDRVTERTRREIGTWPTAESLVEQIVRALQQAADEAPGEAEKGRWRSAAEVIGGMGRDIAVGVITARLGGSSAT